MLYKLLLSVRAFVFYSIFFALSALFMLLLYLALPFPFKLRSNLSRLWSRWIALTAKWVCGLNYQVSGLEHIPPTPVVFLSKHQSAWETIVFPGLLPPNCFVFKKSLIKIPLFGWGMAVCHHIPVDRNAGMQAFKQVVQLGKKRLQEGLSIIIFPEGTRVAPKTSAKFHKTGASLAKSAGVPVIAIAHNSGSYWHRNSWLKHPGTIKVVIGAPIDTRELTTDALNQTVYDWIEQEMRQLESK